jgi:hypothetical protein
MPPRDLDKELRSALLKGQLVKVKELLDEGANIDATDESGRTSLHLASMRGYYEIVTTLLDWDHHMDPVDKDGRTPLHYASYFGHLDIVGELLLFGANIEAVDKNGNTSLMLGAFGPLSVRRTEQMDVVKLLLARGADVTKKNDKGNTAFALARTQEIRDLIQPPPPQVDEVWAGFTQDDFAMFEQIFGDPKVAADFSICPVCHSQVLRTAGCMFIYHNCTSLHPPGLDKNLYEKYLTPGKNQIFWCTVCGRICDNHLHKGIGLIDGPIPKNSQRPEADEEFYGNDCRALGGGGLVEKLARFNAILKTAHEMQADAGKIRVREAKNRLVKAGWEAPLTMDKLALEAQLASKTFPTPISSFPTKGSPGPQVAEAPVPNIQYPDIANPNLLPIVHPNGEDVTLLDEVPNAVQFRHKKADGAVNSHDGELIGLENLMINVLQNDRNKNFASAEFGECWNSAGGCTAKLYPDEIQDAINKSTLTPDVKAKYESILADYRAKFNRRFKIGGGRKKKGGKLKLRGTQMFPLATDAIAECPLLKKGGKKRRTHKIKHKAKKTRKNRR